MNIKRCLSKSCLIRFIVNFLIAAPINAQIQPQWYVHPPESSNVLYAVGSAKVTDLAKAKKYAFSDAVKRLQGKLDTYLQKQLKAFAIQAGLDSDVEYTHSFQTIREQILTISSRYICLDRKSYHREANQYRVFVLAALDLSEMRWVLWQELRNNPFIKTRLRGTAAFQDLEEALDNISPDEKKTQIQRTPIARPFRPPVAHPASPEALVKSFPVSLPSPQGSRDYLSQKIFELGQQIVSQMVQFQKRKVVVVDFPHLNGEVSTFSRYLAEELTTTIFQVSKGKFKVVEQNLLRKVIQEQELSFTGLIDQTNAMQLGRILGADAICTGIVTDLDNKVRINARLIDARDGSLISVAAVEIEKKGSIRKMMSQIFTEVPGENPEKPKGASRPSSSATQNNVFFFEDFSKVREGMMPRGWLGGDKLMVKSDGRHKTLVDFVIANNHSLTIPDVQFPENFELRWTFTFGSLMMWGPQVTLHTGKVKAVIHAEGWCTLNEARDNRRPGYSGKVVQAVLRKEGAIFKLFINGEERLMGRFPNFQPSTSIQLEFQNMRQFQLIEIKGISL